MINQEPQVEEMLDVYVVENLGWASKMVLNHIHEVLETIQIELGEMMIGNTVQFTITKEKMSRSKYDSLEEFIG